VLRRLADFFGLDAAKRYGLANTGTPDSPQEADGFTVRQKRQGNKRGRHEASDPQ
jgi:hypothetical protein